MRDAGSEGDLVLMLTDGGSWVGGIDRPVQRIINDTVPPKLPHLRDGVGLPCRGLTAEPLLTLCATGGCSRNRDTVTNDGCQVRPLPN